MGDGLGLEIDSGGGADGNGIDGRISPPRAVSRSVAAADAPAAPATARTQIASAGIFKFILTA
jgi:hypothetical protein